MCGVVRADMITAHYIMVRSTVIKISGFSRIILSWNAGEFRRRQPFLQAISSPFSMNKYRGASGRNGSTTMCTAEKMAGTQRRTFHSCSRPRISLEETNKRTKSNLKLNLWPVDSLSSELSWTQEQSDQPLSHIKYLSPNNWPDSLPRDPKITEVRVTTPLSFLGEISARYIRCALCPKPGGPRQDVSQSQFKLQVIVLGHMLGRVSPAA